MIENILMLITVIMFVAFVLMFINFIKEIFEIIYKIFQISRKPKIHVINGAYEKYGKDPFHRLSMLDKVNIGDVIFFDSGLWKNIFWQKVGNKDWVTSQELQSKCGGNSERFLEWAKENNELRKEIH